MMDQPNLLEGWVNGDAVRQMETLPYADLLSGCSQLLRNAIKNQDMTDYADPVGLIHSSWYTNEHFRGTYSYRSVASDQMNVWASDLAEPVEDSDGNIRILFAGEATDSKMYSTVHGAVESGYREAERIAKM